MKQFEKIFDYVPELKGRFNSFVVTEFDDSMTVEMQIRVLIKWIKKNIQLTNDMVDYLNEFIKNFDENLYKTVSDVLLIWLEDGTLEKIINETVFQDLNKRNEDVVDVGKFVTDRTGTKDAAKEIREAFEYAKKHNISKIHFPDGNYLIDSLGGFNFRNNEFAFELFDNCFIHGSNGAKLIYGDNMHRKTEQANGGGLFYINNGFNVTFENLRIDMNGSNNLQGAGMRYLTAYPLYFWNTSNVKVDSVKIENMSGRNGIVVGGRVDESFNSLFATITNCELYEGGTTINGNDLQDDFSFIYVDNDFSFVSNNICKNTNFPKRNSGGIELHGNYQVASNNKIFRCHPAFYVSNGIPSKRLNNIIVSDNFLSECNRGIYFYSSGDIHNVNIKGNIINLRWNPNNIIPTAVGILQPRPSNGLFTNSNYVKNLTISGNTFYETYETISQAVRGTGVLLNNVEYCNIENNTFYHLTGNCISFEGTPYGTKHVKIINNNMFDFCNNENPYNTNAISIDYSGSSITPPAQNYNLEHLYVSQNTCVGSNLKQLYFMYLNWNDGSVITNLKVINNELVNIQNKRGNKANLITFIGNEKTLSKTGFDILPSGLIMQWRMIYLNEPNVEMEVPIPVDNLKELFNVQVSSFSSSSEDSSVQITNVAKDKIKIRSKVAPQDVYVTWLGI